MTDTDEARWELHYGVQPPISVVAHAAFGAILGAFHRADAIMR